MHCVFGSSCASLSGTRAKYVNKALLESINIPAANDVPMMQDASESLVLYEALLLRAFDVCGEICRYPKPSDPSAIRIWEASHAFVACGPVACTLRDLCPSGGAVFDAFNKLLVDWPELSSGAMTGEIAYAAVPDLWRRLMCEPPLGTYASLAANFINAHLRPGLKLIELGAGVGNTSRLLNVGADVLYIRTDRSLPLLNQADLPGTTLRYDFNTPSSMTAADIVFAVNAMHCADNPRRTLSYVRAMLRPGGMLILGEGEPRPAGNRPWALDMLCCQFSGWWDRTGFRPRDEWVDDLGAAGYIDIGHQRLFAGEYDLGGLIWARA